MRVYSDINLFNPVVDMSTDNEKETIFAKAVELFDMIRNSDVYIRYNESSVKVRNDFEAQALISELVEMGKTIEQSLSSGDGSYRNKAEFDLLNKRFESNGLVKTFLQSQKDYFNMINAVREAISSKIKIS